MAVRGPKPKAHTLTRRRDPRVHDWTEVLNTPFTAGPDLPARMPNGDAWPAWTRRWWKKLAAMPHCVLWTASDWEFAFDTALLKALFHGSATAAMATEIRNRERVLGTTAEFRRDLRIRYVAAMPTTGRAEVVGLDDYRDL